MKKRIALLSAFYPYRGGIAQFSANLFRAIESKDREVKAYTFKRQYPSVLFPGKTQMVQESDVVDQVPAKRILDTVNPMTYRSAARTIEREHPDVIISQYWMTFFAPSLGLIHKYLGRKNVKRVSILHNVVPHEKRFFDNRANKYFLAHNDAFIVMSDAVLADLLLFKPEAKYLRIDHPAYSHFGESVSRDKAIEKLGLSSDKKYLLFFGFIRKYKGLDVLIEALSELSEEYHVVVAGEAYGDLSFYTDLVGRLNLKDRVHFFDQYISDDEVKYYFSACDLCVLPYRSATQSGITAIAHHFCLPVVATNVGGLSEVIKDGVDGYIVDHPEPSLVANKIKNFFHGDQAKQFKLELERSKADKSWENFADHLLEFIDKL